MTEVQPDCMLRLKLPLEMVMKKLSLKQLQQMEQKEIGFSVWFEITQDRINAFADCTEDHQWIHIDADKARKSALGSTVAHSYLLLSLLMHFNLQNEIFKAPFKMVVNYGLNRVRFLNPVRPGDRIRNRAVLAKVTKKGFRKVLVQVDNTIEIEGQTKPALVAEALALIFL